MRHIPGIDRSQVLLLPEAVDDYVGRDNPVRFIDAFVDGLDLAAAGFERAAPKATGRPGYDPADLLKLYIYGYLNRVRSSRRLEAESKRNLEVIWLLRRLSPDFKTIADFRRINRAAFRQVFREFVRLCRELELFGRELVAVDGTRGSVASLAKGRCVIRGLPVHLMILRWPDGPVAMPWPRSGRTVRDRRRARRSGPRRQCRPGGRTSRPGPCAARASPRSP